MSGALPGIGALTDRVQLQSRQVLPEDEGGHAALFVPVTSLWARVRSLGARAAMLADARGASISHSVVVRFRTDVKPGDRFVHRGRTLSVLSAEDMNGRRAFLSCQCTEMAVSG